MFAAIRSLFNLGSRASTPPITASSELARDATGSSLSNAANELVKPAGDHVQAKTTQPVGASLWELTLAQWCNGDWDSLVLLHINDIENSTDRAKLSLVMACAWLQQGDTTAARLYMCHAMEWGCDKKFAAQLLTAGVHNTLGRAFAIAGDRAGMEQHFRRAVVGSDIPSESASLGRRHVELHRLGMEQTGWGITPAAPHALNEQKRAITYPPHGIISYAQNFEDVILWRALWDVEDGFYIDVGAWDPLIDSVSKAFYEHGWRGVHVEPLPEYAAKIRQDRPDERIYQVLLGAEPGEKTFYYIPETGLSTASKEYAERHQKAGWSIEERKYSVMTLAQLFDQIGERVIHWLKIDVEGMEDEVLRGWGKNKARPLIVLIEATEPNSTKPSWGEWEYRMHDLGYNFTYFDGLNRFYLVKSMSAILLDRLGIPPNVFDKSRRI